MSVNLGDKVKEKVTGFTGIVVSISTHLYGCNRVGVQPPVGTDSKVPDCMWFDIDGVEVVERSVVTGHTNKPESARTGGPALPGQTPTRSNPKLR